MWDLLIFIAVAFGGVFGLIAYAIHWANQKNVKQGKSAPEQNIDEAKPNAMQQRPKGCLYRIAMLLLAVIFFCIAALAWALWQTGG